MTASTIDTSLDDVYTAIKTALMLWLGFDNAHVVQGYGNRVAMPDGPFINMTVTLNKRLRTNVDTWDQTTDDPTTIQQEVGMQVTLQLDVYGPTSGDQAVILTGLLRDPVGCIQLAPTCQPLYSDDPIRAPLVDAEEEYEDKWIVKAQLQYNPTISTPQEFADTLALDVINVYEAYPP